MRDGGEDPPPPRPFAIGAPPIDPPPPPEPSCARPHRPSAAIDFMPRGMLRHPDEMLRCKELERYAGG